MTLGFDVLHELEATKTVSLTLNKDDNIHKSQAL